MGRAYLLLHLCSVQIERAGEAPLLVVAMGSMGSRTAVRYDTASEIQETSQLVTHICSPVPSPYKPVLTLTQNGSSPGS